MARRSISSTSEKRRWQCAKENLSPSIQKTRIPESLPTFRKSAPRQAKSSPTPSSCAILPECLQDPSAPPKSLSDAPHIRRRKRIHEPENERPEKRRRTDPQAVLEPLPGVGPRLHLSEKNLRTHNRLLGTDKDDQGSQQGSMDDASNPSGASGASGRQRRKRRATNGAQSETESQQSTNPVTDSLHSQQSSNTPSYYRWVILKKAKVRISSRPPPEEIQNKVDAIIKKASPERAESLSNIAEKLCDSFAVVLDIAAGEDDCVELLYQALSSMDDLGRLTFPRKADWRISLKPRVPQRSWDFSFLDVAQPGLDDPTVPLGAQQLADANYPSPHTSGSAIISNREVTARARRNEDMPPPPSPLLKERLRASEKDSSLVKTPRPDVTTGILTHVLVQKLQAYDLTGTAAEMFLQKLQEQTTYRNEQREQVLTSEPTQRPLQTLFPFLIVEGKSYATGKTVFEAQNQAAVAGACALKILHDLADLADRADANSGSRAGVDHPLVFSICTEGPSHELWVHYTTVEDGVRIFNMSILRAWHASLRDEVLRFLTAVDNVITWGSGDFLDDVVERLGKIAKRVWVAGEGGT